MGEAAKQAQAAAIAAALRDLANRLERGAVEWWEYHIDRGLHETGEDEGAWAIHEPTGVYELMLTYRTKQD